MKVLGLLARKGGAGKTTLAIHLAVLAQETRKRVLLVDLDPQRSSAGWWRAREAATPELEPADPDKLSAILSTARKQGVALVVLDTRPSVEADAIQVALLADVIVIPTRPAILDLRAILETLEIVKGSRKAHVVLNACPPARGISDAPAAIDARNALKAFGVPVCPATVSQRAVFSHALVGGLTATEAEPNGKAAAEMRAVWSYIEKELAR